MDIAFRFAEMFTLLLWSMVALLALVILHTIVGHIKFDRGDEDEDDSPGDPLPDNHLAARLRRCEPSLN